MKWEYRVLHRHKRALFGWEWSDGPSKLEPEDRLNELGQDGWELVSLSYDVEDGSTNSVSNYVLKRPIA